MRPWCAVTRTPGTRLITCGAEKTHGKCVLQSVHWKWRGRGALLCASTCTPGTRLVACGANREERKFSGAIGKRVSKNWGGAVAPVVRRQPRPQHVTCSAALRNLVVQVPTFVLASSDAKTHDLAIHQEVQSLSPFLLPPPLLTSPHPSSCKCHAQLRYCQTHTTAAVPACQLKWAQACHRMSVC